MAATIRVTDTLALNNGLGDTPTLTKVNDIAMVGTAFDTHVETYNNTPATVSISAAVILEGARWFKIQNPSALYTLLVSLDNGATYPISLLPLEASGSIPLSVAPTVNPQIKVMVSTVQTVTNCPVFITGR